MLTIQSTPVRGTTVVGTLRAAPVVDGVVAESKSTSST
jgi:hypothetical protein